MTFKWCGNLNVEAMNVLGELHPRMLDFFVFLKG